MLIVVCGGAASGKSTFAESLLDEINEEKYYIATMEPLDEESHKRIDKHRLARKDKGFETIECYTGIESAVRRVGDGSALLECMSNLLANEMYSPSGHVIDHNRAEAITRYIIDPIVSGGKQTRYLVVVSNEVFSDDQNYDESTLEYIDNLGFINRELLKHADEAYMVICGIPRRLK